MGAVKPHTLTLMHVKTSYPMSPERMEGGLVGHYNLNCDPKKQQNQAETGVFDATTPRKIYETQPHCTQ
jgi:hypothetical protein